MSEMNLSHILQHKLRAWSIYPQGSSDAFDTLFMTHWRFLHFAEWKHVTMSFMDFSTLFNQCGVGFQTLADMRPSLSVVREIIWTLHVYFFIQETKKLQKFDLLT